MAFSRKSRQRRHSLAIIVGMANLMCLGIVNGFSVFKSSQKVANYHSSSQTQLSSSIIQILKEKFRPQVPVEIKTDGDIMLEFLQEKPWRATKIKNLKVVYRPWKDGWMERYRAEDDDSIYLYTINENKRGWDKTRADEVWHWPWMWTKVKSERLSWIMKVFGEDVDAVTVQEHMEIDNFFSEFDLPVRWGILRIKELDVLNVIALNTVFFTDFTGVRPTDLGLRPDGSVKTCSVQFANCISSSNSPGDTDHYAPPFKWSRSKSPDQAYDEIKEVYMKYPKRGLKWSSGWIDRGGWKPQEFGGPYFHAQAESQAFHYTDDIELVLDVATREVQYRSSTRIGQRDWDVQRLRYNQFARMLEKKGGWDIQPMERLNWYLRTPYRWSQLLSDKALDASERTADRILASVGGLTSSNNADTEGGARRVLQEISDATQPYFSAAKAYFQPIDEKLKNYVELIRLDPKVEEIIQKFTSYEQLIEGSLRDIRISIRSVADQISHSASDVLKLYEDPLPIDAPDTERRNAVDKKNAELRGLFSEPVGGAKKAPSVEGLPSISSSSVDELDIGSLNLDPTDSKNVVITENESSGVNLDTATDLSRSPWTQTASPFILEKSSTSSTISAKTPAALTSADVNARRRAKAAADNKSVGVKAEQAGSDNDVEWIVDAFSADTPESSEAAIRGMSSSGRSVNRRRMQQEQKKLQTAPQLNVQESRILKTRLDELRKANGLFVSEPINEDAEKKLIDFFKQ